MVACSVQRTLLTAPWYEHREPQLQICSPSPRSSLGRHLDSEAAHGHGKGLPISFRRLPAPCAITSE